jgi:hypothetical protein
VDYVGGTCFGLARTRRATPAGAVLLGGALLGPAFLWPGVDGWALAVAAQNAAI